MSSLAKQIKEASQIQTQAIVKPLLIEQCDKLNKYRQGDLKAMELRLQKSISVSETKVLREIAAAEKRITKELEDAQLWILGTYIIFTVLLFAMVLLRS